MLTVFSFSNAEAGALGYKEGRWILKAKESYFKTSSNYNSEGVVKELPLGQSLSLITSNLSATYDIGTSWALFAGLDLVGSTSTGLDFQRSRFAPTDLKLGTDFVAMSGFVDVVPEAIISIPVSSVDENTDDVVLNDGAFEIKAGSYLSKHFDWISGYVYLGYSKKMGGLASSIPYEFQLIKDFGGVQLGAGITGYQSLEDDEYTDTPFQRSKVTSRVNGGSEKFYSVNPSLTEVGVNLGFAINSEFYTRLGANQTIMGQNTAYGTTFWLSLSYAFGETPRASYREERRTKERRSIEEKQDFKPEEYEESSVFNEAVKDISKEDVRSTRPVEKLKPSKTPIKVKLKRKRR